MPEWLIYGQFFIYLKDITRNFVWLFQEGPIQLYWRDRMISDQELIE
jgi:hypothetical protein